MTTNKQIEANKINALKGGVKTEEGKEIISKNAVSHGLTSNRILSNEQELYSSVLNELIEEYNPEGYSEMILCERIAFHQMKLLRLVNIESVFIEKSKIQSEIEYLEYKQPNKTMFLIPIIESYESSNDEEIAEQYQKQINKLNEKIQILQKKCIKLSSFDMLERLQRYENNIETRLMRAIKEFFQLKITKQKLKVSKPTV